MNSPNRRDFLATASAALLGTLAAGRPRILKGAEGKEEEIRPTADCVVVLWMAGGMAHTETFDPKRYTPFEKGLESNTRLEHVSLDSDGGRHHPHFAGTRKDCGRARPGHA